MHRNTLSHGAQPAGVPLRQFTAYIEECRRQPRDDVMTGLATATFPDGTLPPSTT